MDNKNINIVALDCFTVNPGDLSWEEIKQFGNLTIYQRSTPKEIICRAKDADIILTNKVSINREVIASLPNLKYIGEMATGYNNIDIEACKERGITVCNIPAYSTDSVAQMVFAHLLNIAMMPDYYSSETRLGKWSSKKDFCYWDTPLMELSNKTLGIVGLGNIGKKVAEIAHAFGMDVNAFTSKPSSMLPDNIRKTTLEGLFATSDVVTLHCPLNDSTYKMINAETLAMMHQGTILINTGRGGLIDEDAVANALESQHLRAYCADVMTQEPPEANNRLIKAPHAYITPHIAWATLEARRRLMKIAVENIRKYLEGKPQNIINK